MNELSESLSAKEIEEVNELLIWVIYGFEWLFIDELEAGLFLRFEKTSLQPLEKKLRGKYAKLFSNPDYGVAVDEDTAEVVKFIRSTTRTTEDSAPKISATITITNADMRTVQSFLWSLNEKAMIEKFVFDNSAALTTFKGKIQVNEFDAHLVIVKQAFKMFSLEPDDRTSALTQYLLDRLPDHLDKLHDASGMDELMPSEKREIGKGVFNLVADGEVIEKFWLHRKNNRDTVSTVNWVVDRSRAEPFWKWLEDPEAIRALGKKDREWVKQRRAESDPNRALLRPSTVVVANNWLRGRTWDVSQAFAWIRAFLLIVSSFLCS